ncbi:MAG: SwmB-cell surface protein required for swimming motility, partial [Cyanobacteriota bacterium]
GTTPRTNDGKPLTTLLGEEIIAAGYYDFTRLTPTGDGASFRYSTPDQNGKVYITGVDINFTDNLFGDNSVTVGTIVDPGVPVSVLPELGNDTVLSGIGLNAIVPNFFNGLNTVNDPSRYTGTGTSMTPGPGGGLDLIGSGGGNDGSLAAMALMGGGGAGGSGEGQGLQNQRRGDGQGEADGDGNANGLGGNGQQPGAGAGGEGLSAMKLGGQDVARIPRDRGMALQPLIDALAGKGDGDKPGSFVLSRLQEGSLMGNHLLDALALGAGVTYGLYAPRVAAVGQRGLKKLVTQVKRATGMGVAAAAVKDQRVISVFAMRLDNGTERLVAARVSSDGLTIVAQQDLPSGAGVDTPGSQAQVDYGTRQLLDRLRGSGIGQTDQVLLDPRLQNQATLVQSLGDSTDLLLTRNLESGVARCSPEQQAALHNQPLPEQHPLAELLQQRIASYGRVMPPPQAAVATMVELGIALAANPPTVS